MATEAASFIAELDSARPPGNEPVGEGDDHLRMLKNVLKKQFTGGSTGLTGPVTVTHTEMNYLSGLTQNVQAAFNNLIATDIIVDGRLDTLEFLAQGNLENLYAPTGTRMVFYQAAAPTGWTKVPSLDDHMLVINNGFGGQSGGTQTPVSLNIHHAHTTGDVSLTSAQMPGHAHSVPTHEHSTGGTTTGSGVHGIFEGNILTSIAGNNGVAGNGEAHNHGSTTGLNWTLGALNTNNNVWAPKYLNMILCSKDAPP